LVELGTGERTAVRHPYFLSSLGRRINCVPALRDRLWRLEEATLDWVWRVLGAGDPDTVSARGERLGQLIGPRLRNPNGHQGQQARIQRNRVMEGSYLRRHRHLQAPA
jgi:hypothetical protein